MNESLELKLELKKEDNIEYKEKAIKNNIIYAINTTYQLLRLYYLIFIKSF